MTAYRRGIMINEFNRLCYQCQKNAIKNIRLSRISCNVYNTHRYERYSNSRNNDSKPVPFQTIMAWYLGGSVVLYLCDKIFHAMK